jgi:NADH dehydrogenase [ubiquinone] 1 alpha subcomplex assembly factor 7
VTALRDHLAARIRAEGPITVADFMAEALGHPEHGYYRQGDPFGTDGDFITAPEVSQMFGELVGLWGAVVWKMAGEPTPLRLVELGPGRGTLMADMLRAMASQPGLGAALDIHLVETSPPLRSRQQAALGGRPARWHDTLTTVPGGPALIVANEFFDALPVRQLVRNADGWDERMVALDGEGTLVFTTRPCPAPPMAPPRALAAAPPGAIWELAEAGAGVAAALSARLARDGGAALIVDYGTARSHPGDTLQAVRGPPPGPPRQTPGQADVTAHVDFEALMRSALDAGARPHGPVTQGAWLRALGIEARAAQLKRAADPAQAADIDSALDRLIGPEGMGTLFKVLALTGPGLTAPPGFESDS